jgi:hypothetical protein
LDTVLVAQVRALESYREYGDKEVLRDGVYVEEPHGVRDFHLVRKTP